ncbi:MAG: HAD family hydrolase [Bdellovibrionia bacterium]
MKYKPYSPQVWEQIKTSIMMAKDQGQKLIAAFDADGTLWDTDLGEQFFHFQIDNKLVNLPPEPWNHYLEMKKINNDPRSAYLWLAQINRGKTLEQVREWAQQSFKAIQPNPIFEEQKRLIEILLKENVQIFVVTASVKWAVEPGALAIGLSHDNVIGVETQVENGIVGDTGLFPITYRQGKVEALLQKTQGQKPFLASGNTMGDYELLLSATHMSLAVSAAARDDRLFKTEAELQNSTSHFKNGVAHRFI